MAECYKCKVVLPGNWVISGNNKYGRYVGVYGCFLFPDSHPPQNTWVYSYCFDCWKNEIANNLQKWGIKDTQYEQALEKTKQAETNLQSEKKERDQVIKEKEELKKVIKEKESRINTLEQRIVELESGQKSVDTIYEQAGLQKIVDFIQKLPKDDLEVIKELGFNDDIIKSQLTKYPFFLFLYFLIFLILFYFLIFLI